MATYRDNFNKSSERGSYIMKDFVFGDTVTLPAIRKTFTVANSLEITAATNGYKGGDAGHGSRTVVGFRDRAGTAIEARVIPSSLYGNGGVEIMLAGDCELMVFIDALRYAADSLERLADEARERDKEQDPEEDPKE